MSDRTYWHVPGARSWHALDDANPWLGLCGRKAANVSRTAWGRESADRVPADGHLCGSCARVIAARTDVES